MDIITEEILRYYDHFVIPFLIGTIILFSVIIYKYIRWFIILPRKDKLTAAKGLFTLKSVKAVGEVMSESLLHRRIFKTNPLLGYMHMSLAFGWFLLIVVGWIEASMHLTGEIVPIHAHVFYKYFASGIDTSSSARFLSNIMDLLLLFVLTGVTLAWIKRLKSRSLGLKRTTEHVIGDKIALTALWLIFPLRLLAESGSSGLKQMPSFLTGNLGQIMVAGFGENFVASLTPILWWSYSVSLAVFFIAMPFSRYMHIFTEIPLIFLRNYGIKSGDNEKSFDNFQLEACSRCGICIDPCQMQSDVGCNNMQAVYFIRDRRYHKLSQEVTSNCLMCGRCTVKCPVGIDVNALRLNSRENFSEVPPDNRYSYLKGLDLSEGGGKTGYFAGCMTLLTPKIMKSMESIFLKVEEQVWWADKNGGVCCGRPLKLSGEIAAAERMMQYNKELFAKHGITTLVTSCPICLKVFKEDYNLKNIEVLHHSQYILGLIKEGKIKPKYSDILYTYHDPCELGRGNNIYQEPRDIINGYGNLIELRENKNNSFCCGSSLGNLIISDKQQDTIGRELLKRISDTGAEKVVTACPLCKKALSRNSSQALDISELVAASL